MSGLVSIAGVSRPRSAPGSRSRLRRLRPLLTAVLLAGLLPGIAAGPTAIAAEDDEPPSPLTVNLTRLVPATIPATGTVTLAGTVTNDSDETWIAINVLPFVSAAPMTSRDELAAAAKTPLTTEVGTRLVEPGQFQAIGDLAPGASSGFRISVPAAALRAETSGAAGVYWIGVHALGQNTVGRDDLADGRARTFIPLVRGKATTSVAVVVPVRERVRRDPGGRVLGTTGWSDDLTPAGRLGRLGAFLDTSGNSPTTLLIDPAVVEAVTDLSGNNPLLSLGDGEPVEPEPSPSPTQNPTQDPTQSPSRTANRLEPSDRANAETWIRRITAAAERHTVLRLPYADPDVNSLARRAPGLLELAATLSAQTFERLGVASVPAVAPANGWLDDTLLGQLGDALLLVSDHSAPRTRTQWKTTQGQDLVFSDEQAASGGPGPTERLDALALRQRIISDAALRTGQAGPLVVLLPHNWDPGPAWQLADFFAGLEQPWLDLVALDRAPSPSPVDTPGRSSDPGTPVFDAPLGYPAAQDALELPQANVDATRSLLRTTDALDQLLRSTNDIAHDLAGIAFNAVSLHARVDRPRARGQVLATNSTMLARLDDVEVLGTDFVTLSGGSGTLAVTVVNGLDQPITVGVEARTAAAGVQIESTAPFEMAPGQRTVLRLKAEASGVGVNQVVLSSVTTEGTAVGSPLIFSLRTSQVGNLIWAILGAGALLLVVMIARRIRRGLREHRWRRG